MKINTKGSFLSSQELKKKNSDEKFYLSKVLTDNDDLLTVFSNDYPVYERGEIVDVTIDINFERNSIYVSFC